MQTDTTSPQGHDPAQNARGSHDPQIMAAELLRSAEGRKKFFLDLKENNRGRLVKITEDVGGRRDTIMIPIGDVREIAALLIRLATFSEANP